MFILTSLEEMKHILKVVFPLDIRIKFIYN